MGPGRVAVFLLGAAMPSPMLAHAQSVFHAQDFPRQEIVSNESPVADRGLFAIHNPRNQTIPL